MYRTKECVDEFEYKFKDSETGKIKKFKITEKRIVTFNPKLAKKQIYEINKEVEKAKLLKASQAKRSEYGDSAKYVIFTTTDKKGNNTNGKIKVTMNEDLIKKSLSQAVLSPIFSCHDVVLLLVFIHFRICGFQKRLKIRVLCAAYRRTEGRGSTQLAFCRFQ